MLKWKNMNKFVYLLKNFKISHFYDHTVRENNVRYIEGLLWDFDRN